MGTEPGRASAGTGNKSQGHTPRARLGHATGDPYSFFWDRENKKREKARHNADVFRKQARPLLPKHRQLDPSSKNPTREAAIGGGRLDSMGQT